jgi:hypothetical protein
MRMDENEHVVAGYRFLDLQDYKEAKREAETVDYIRKNTDLKDINKVLKLYHRLVERKTLNTVIGFAFLNELRDKIIRSGIIEEKALIKIPIEKELSPIRNNRNGLVQEKEKKYQASIAEYKVKLRNSRIISAFLAFIIIAMIVITVFGTPEMYAVFERIG